MLRSTFLVLLAFLLVSDCVDGRKTRRNGGKIRLRCRAWKPGRDVALDPPQNATILCPEGGKLFEINVSSKASRQSCSGWQAETLVKSMACVGSVHCKDILLTNATPIIKSSDNACLGRHPDRVSASALCTRKDVAIEHLEKSTLKPADSGILASPHFPWQYSSDPVKVTATMRPRNSRRSFYYTLRKLDLAPGDSLTVKGRREKRYSVNNNSNQSRHDHVMAKDGEVTVTFEATNDFVSGHGFILCYQWSDSAVENVCKELTVAPYKVKTCRPRGRNKCGKKCQRKCQKKRGKKRGKKCGKKERRNGRTGKRSTTTTVTPE